MLSPQRLRHSKHGSVIPAFGSVTTRPALWPVSFFIAPFRSPLSLSPALLHGSSRRGKK
jgi:hypothetical protein